eukprot:jgi/Mesvir1/540/Mv11397-RA.1
MERLPFLRQGTVVSTQVLRLLQEQAAELAALRAQQATQLSQQATLVEETVRLALERAESTAEARLLRSALSNGGRRRQPRKLHAPAKLRPNATPRPGRLPTRRLLPRKRGDMRRCVTNADTSTKSAVGQVHYATLSPVSHASDQRSTAGRRGNGAG